MLRRLRTSRTGGCLFCVGLWLGSAAAADETPPLVADIATRSAPAEHPLQAVVRWAQRELPRIEKIEDYSATLVSRERVTGRLNDHEYLAIKIRHQPFSVYTQFLAPASLKGQEAIYVDGQNDGKLWGHRPSNIMGTLVMQPDSPIAMRNRRYPMTEIGLVNLVRRLLEVGQEDLQHDECAVKFFTGAKINQYTCTCIQVTHPTPRRHFRFHIARIFIDDRLQLPIRYESYAWPSEPDSAPQLLEEYTYLDLKINNGFSDRDFSIDNPAYRFTPGHTQVGAK